MSATSPYGFPVRTGSDMVEVRRRKEPQTLGTTTTSRKNKQFLSCHNSKSNRAEKETHFLLNFPSSVAVTSAMVQEACSVPSERPHVQTCAKVCVRMMPSQAVGNCTFFSLIMSPAFGHLFKAHLMCPFPFVTVRKMKKQ